MSMDRQTVVSTGTPELTSEHKPAILKELESIGLERLTTPESRTFRHWNKTPWFLVSRTSVNLAKMENLAVTFVKAVDQTTGIQVVFATILATESVLGWHPNNNYLRIRILILNNNDGLLEEWHVTERHPITCASQNEPFSYRATFKPDWFELVEKVFVIIEPVTWYAC